VAPAGLTPLAVTVEVRALPPQGRRPADDGHRPADDGSPAPARAFRLSRAVGESELRLAGDLPFEPGRPVTAELTLPDDDRPLLATGVVRAVPPDDEATEGEAGRPRAIAWKTLDADARRRLAAYMQERMRSP